MSQEPEGLSEREQMIALLVEHVRKINRVVASGLHEGVALREAADAILALRRPPPTVLSLLERIETLEAERDAALNERDDAETSADAWLLECKIANARAEKAEASLHEARKALEPFASLKIPENPSSDNAPFWAIVRVADVRSALSALSEGGGGNGPSTTGLPCAPDFLPPPESGGAS